MLSIALKRLWNRPLLTLLSIAGVMLAVGLVTSIPILAQAMSFVVLQEELEAISAQSGRPLFPMRAYVLPGGRYPLSLARTRELSQLVIDTLQTQVGLPARSLTRHIETSSMILQTRESDARYSAKNRILADSITLAVLSDVEPHLTFVEGEAMATASSAGDVLNVWINHTMADEMGIQTGETYEVRNLGRGATIPVRIAGTWKAIDPADGYWFIDPEPSQLRTLLVRETDYEALAEPALHEQVGFASWYLIMDDRQLSADKMQDYIDGIEEAAKALSLSLPDTRIDGSPLEALGSSVSREADLTALLFVFSVPLMGFLLYFSVLISTITARWQRRETAMLVSRGIRSRQLVIVGLIESLAVISIGCPLGILTGVQLARWMGYTRSFLSFTWREPLPVSPLSFNVPMVALAVAAVLIARLGPIRRAARTSVVEHERARARPPDKPFWQRWYLDVALLIVAMYARDRLLKEGTLVPQVERLRGGAVAEGTSWFARFMDSIYPQAFREQDPLLFLVPALFTLALSLLLVRLFPLLMWAGDRLCAWGHRVAPYLAFRQLARQSDQYTSALLLVITSLSLGAFMASMAASLDGWLVDQVYYAIGADVQLKQMARQSDDPFAPPPSPADGAWVLAPETYLEIPGVTGAARVCMYPTVLNVLDQPPLTGVFIGIDRLDLPKVLFFRADFGQASLGEMMNQLAEQVNGVIVSEQTLAYGGYDIGDQLVMHIYLSNEMILEHEFTIVGTYTYFPTVYEARDGKTAVIGNLDYLYDQAGATLIHNVWLEIDPGSDPEAMKQEIKNMGVYINLWLDTRDEIAAELARVERVGIFGTLTFGFLGAAVLSGIGLLVYNYASLQERLFRFTLLRAVGLSLRQVAGQVGIEYLVLMAYGIVGGVGIGVLAGRWFIPFFQASDGNVLNPPPLRCIIAWGGIGQIAAAFAIALVLAQGVVIGAALRSGVFQALRMGDRE